MKEDQGSPDIQATALTQTARTKQWGKRLEESKDYEEPKKTFKKSYNL